VVSISVFPAAIFAFSVTGIHFLQAILKFLCEFICKFFHILLDIFIDMSSKLLLAIYAAPEISQHIDIRLYTAKYERLLPVMPSSTA